MAVDHALGVAGGAARVTHGRGRALVEVGPVEAGLLGGEQLLVGRASPPAPTVSPSPHHDDVSTVVSSSRDRGQQRDQRGVDDDHPVLGVVDHVGQLVGESRMLRVCSTAPMHGTAR